LEREIVMNTIFGIHGNNEINFFSLESAEDYLMESYPEHCGRKEQVMDFTENMIWEDTLITCESCGNKILHSDMDSDWVRTGGCCDCTNTWVCGCRH
jgi:hypothetical protein